MTLEEAFHKQKKELREAQREIARLNKELEMYRTGICSQEAFHKQKEELLASQKENIKLKKELDSFRKGIASEEIFQNHLSHIQGLKNKVSHYSNVAERYLELYSKEKERNRELALKLFTLENENLHLKDRIELYKSSDEPDDAQKQIQALTEEIAKLTAKLNNNSSNAGIPTSKTALNQKKLIPNSRKKSDKKKGGQPGHAKSEMEMFCAGEITITENHELLQCPNCGSSNLEEISVKIKDELDYEVKVIKKRHRFIEYTCLDCNSVVKVPYNGLVAQNQYGSCIQAMALAFMNLGFVSINRTRKILSGFSSKPLSLSEGYLIKLQKRHAKRLNSFVSDIKNALYDIPILYWDDTVIFINSSRACMRFYGNDKLAFYTAHQHKNLEGILDDNILPVLNGDTIVMHDHNSINYHDGFLFRNVECIQHLERDLQKIIDISHHSWADDLKSLIQKMLHERKQLIEDGIKGYSQKEICCFLNSLDELIERGINENTLDARHYYQSDEKALLTRLVSYKDNYFDWIKDFNIPTTNNLSERSLRFVKTKDKVSGQFQSVEYASFFANIRTYLETCTRNGINEYFALLRLTQGNPFSLEEILSGT